MNTFLHLLDDQTLPANTADILRLSTQYPFPGLADALFMLERRHGPFDLRSVLLARQLLNPKGFTHPETDRIGGVWDISFTPTLFECRLQLHDGEVAILFNEAYQPTDLGSGALIRDNGEITIRNCGFDRVISIKRGCCRSEEFCHLNRRDGWGVTELDERKSDDRQVIDRLKTVNAALGGTLRTGILDYCRYLNRAGFVGKIWSLSAEYNHSHKVLQQL